MWCICTVYCKLEKVVGRFLALAYHDLPGDKGEDHTNLSKDSKLPV